MKKATIMLPLQRFKDLLIAYQEQMNEDLNELVLGADLLASRPNYLTVDEHGFYHVQVSGTIDEVLKGLEAQLEKVKRIKAQKETPR